ncbi:MAG: TIGR03564 family F420-dependent LLM class oxidoreductase [Chloroflexi bacterium]|nr:TIGR03564 family F420-dependent LLM class oxidoreductase [Chloroflexota bacterium]
MKIGIGIGPLPRDKRDLNGNIEWVVDAESDGFDSLWISHGMSIDSLQLVALAGQRTSRIELITGVIPVYSRSPLLMAQEALTANEAAGGRLSLGLGVAHPESTATLWNATYDRPAKYMREYLGALSPLLEERAVDFSGEMIITSASMGFKSAPTPPVLIAAMAPMMLKLAGEQTAGTILWMCGRKTVETHIAPRINEAADSADRPAPRICVALPICVTDEPEAARESVAATLGGYGRLINYRKALDIEGASGPEDVAIVGNEDEVEAQLRAFAAAGATDFFASFTATRRGDTESPIRTRDLLKRLVGKV